MCTVINILSLPMNLTSTEVYLPSPLVKYYCLKCFLYGHWAPYQRFLNFVLVIKNHLKFPRSKIVCYVYPNFYPFHCSFFMKVKTFLVIISFSLETSFSHPLRESLPTINLSLFLQLKMSLFSLHREGKKI